MGREAGGRRGGGGRRRRKRRGIKKKRNLRRDEENSSVLMYTLMKWFTAYGAPSQGRAGQGLPAKVLYCARGGLPAKGKTHGLPAKGKMHTYSVHEALDVTYNPVAV